MLKSRIREKSKLNNKKFLLALCVCVIFLGTAYSSLNQVLTLTGTAIIKGKGTGSGGDDYEDLGGGLARGNLDAYISNSSSMWRSGTEWNAPITLVIENNNNFDTTNWDVVFYAPGITGLTAYLNGVETSIDSDTDTGTLTISRGQQGVIKKGESKTVEVVLKFNNELLEAVLDRLSPEELELVTDQDRSIIYGSTIGDISKKLKTLVFNNIMYNMAGTPTANVVEVAAHTIFEPEVVLEPFSYTYGDLTFNVDFYEYVRDYDGINVTTAKISVTNNSDKAVTALDFTLRYNSPLDSSKTGNVVGNWGQDGGGNKFENQTNITIVESATEYIKLSAPSYGLLTAGQTRNYYVSQILTELKFKSFIFENVSYSLDGVPYEPSALENINLEYNEDIELNTNTNTSINTNTNSENDVTNTSNTSNTTNTNTNVVNNTITSGTNEVVNETVENTNTTVEDNTTQDNVNDNESSDVENESTSEDLSEDVVNNEEIENKETSEEIKETTIEE